MPTGVAIRDPREHLFEAAERVIVRSGPHALTSRAVTTEAGVAKGVLHRHFADFDGFLAELVTDRIRRVERQAVELRESAGTRTVPDNLTDALITVFGPVALAVVSLIIFRDDLRARLRRPARPGPPLLSDAAAMLTDYLAAERDLGRLPAAADIRTLALTLIGTAHVVFADRGGEPADRAAVHHFVTSVVPAG